MKNMSHTCQNLLLRCMDFRLEPYFEAWLKNNGYLGETDIISIAGSCKNLAADPQGCFAIEILSQIDLGYQKHGVRRILLTMHRDCGAYGGQTTFASAEAEKIKLVADMKKVKDLLKTKYQDLEVLMFLADQENAGWRLEKISD